METSAYITKEEFIEKYKFLHYLASKDDEVMESYESYCSTIRKIRSNMIKELKMMRYPGNARAMYNDYLNKISVSSYRRYLYEKSPICGICFRIIDGFRYATIDHIYPLSRGGSNSMDNKQLAHAFCNVLKSDKIDFKMPRLCLQKL